ncbi:hypothetical protein H6F90_29780 [Trichocoleus sp. FACHB-591]|uniref:hypothetical protein n=1 Tax=Trichocoleus sp. FACHB-591 TaxID=2692872 RepID=UPI00168A3B1A|nr:hypothetical protein [Trichocoleus sp. FACHB-591]MBD2099257.1 hypothetical protein [Trichocoleus sp. FACHB-591]
MQLEAQAPELSLEVVQQFLDELLMAQVLQEQEVAQLMAEFMAGSPERIFALVQQYFEAQKEPVNPKMLRFKFGGVEFHPDFFWSLVIPNSLEDAAFKFSAGLVISITLALTCNAIWPVQPVVSQPITRSY